MNALYSCPRLILRSVSLRVDSTLNSSEIKVFLAIVSIISIFSSSARSGGVPMANDIEMLQRLGLQRAQVTGISVSIGERPEIDDEFATLETSATDC